MAKRTSRERRNMGVIIGARSSAWHVSSLLARLFPVEAFELLGHERVVGAEFEGAAFKTNGFVRMPEAELDFGGGVEQGGVLVVVGEGGVDQALGFVEALAATGAEPGELVHADGVVRAGVEGGFLRG